MSDNARIVLAIDDDPEWLEFTALALGDDYEVKSAACADDAVSLAKDLKPSVIVLDVMMAEHKDGFTAFSELQSDDACKGIPVILFSEVNAVTNLGFGVDDLKTYLGSSPVVFLEKPVSAASFKAEVDKAVAASLTADQEIN